jgi:cytochrome c
MIFHKGAMPRFAAFTITAAALLAPVAMLTPTPVRAQLAHTCAPMANTEFKMTTVVSRATGISEPIKMTFDMDASGVVDIYFVERMGAVKKYIGASKTVVTIETINIFIGYEDGLTGIVLDPGFKTNRWMYLYYGFGNTQDFKFRVTRHTLNAQNKFEAGSEKLIIDIPATASRMHTGGAMLFDGAGDLWITTGENQSGEEGPPNTNDLRGKILRIRPLAAGGYTVPDGNLFPKGTAKTKPEIYVMGGRNPYSLSLDPVRKAVTWGDIGPDGKGLTEEHNLTTVPGNFGYPYFAGNNIQLMGSGTAAAPKNTNAKNTGLVDLPPAIAATNSYAQQAAITGPIYRYNGKLKTPGKFPPHFDGLWIVTDFQTGYMDTISLTPAGAKKNQGRIFTNMRFDRPIDLQTGPDGALYVMNYAGWFGPATTTGIVRIEYTGACSPEDIGTSLNPGRVPVFKADIKARGMAVEVTGYEGNHELVIGDMRGRTLAAFRGTGDRKYGLAEAVGNRPGLYTARLVTPEGVATGTLVLDGR